MDTENKNIIYKFEAPLHFANVGLFLNKCDKIIAQLNKEIMKTENLSNLTNSTVCNNFFY